MGFEPIDQEIVDDVYAVPSAVGHRLARNIRAARNSRTRACGMAWDLRAPPVMCGVPTGRGSQQRGVLLVPWRRSPHETHIKVQLRHEVKAAGVTLGAFLLRYAGLGGLLPANEAEGTLATGVQTSTLTLDCSDLPLRFLVGITWLSEEDEASAETAYAKGVVTDTALLGWTHRAVLLDQSTEWGSGPTALADDVVPYRLDFRDSATVDVNDVPRSRLVIRSREDITGSGGTASYLHVWPPFDQSSVEFGALGLTHWVDRIPIGYSELHGLQIYASAVRAFGDFGSVHDARSPTSASVQQSRAMEIAKVVGEQTMVRALGFPSPDNTVNDPEESAMGQLDRLSTSISVHDGHAWREIASCVVGDGDPIKFGDAGLPTARAAYVVDILVVGSVHSHRPVRSILEMRAVCTDLSGSNLTAGPTQIVPIDFATTPTWRGRVPEELRPGYWKRFPGESLSQVPVRRPMRGAYPERLLESIPIAVVQLWVKDTGDISERRRLSVQVAVESDAVLDERDEPILEVLGWHVSDVASIDIDEVGA